MVRINNTMIIMAPLLMTTFSPEDFGFSFGTKKYIITAGISCVAARAVSTASRPLQCVDLSCMLASEVLEGCGRDALPPR